MIISSIKTYIVLVNVARCCRNLMWLLYAKIPVLFCDDMLPCLYDFAGIEQEQNGQISFLDTITT